MSYIAFELDALNKAPAVARAARVSEDSIIGGLARMWAYAFREQADTLSRLQVAGFFDVQADVVPALMAFGFIEENGEGFRVRGADRYKRVSDARRKGAEKTNAAKRERAVERRSSDAQATLKSVDERALNDALTPSTEHRTPNTITTTTVAPEPKQRLAVVYAKPDKEPDLWLAEDFFAWAQWKRQEAGLMGEKQRPRDLGSWFSVALMELGGNVEVLQEAFYRFGDDKFWQAKTPALPFAGFMSQWERFIPRGGSRAQP